MKRLIRVLETVCFMVFCIISIRSISFAAEQTYNPETPHMIVNQIYGAGKGEWASHSFIELLKLPTP